MARKKNVRVEEYEEILYCSKCEADELKEDDFYKFHNDSVIYKTGFRPFCKSCIAEMFWYYYEQYCNHTSREIRISMSLDRICQVLDIPFVFKVLEPCMNMVKAQAKQLNRAIDDKFLTPYTGRYMQVMNGNYKNIYAADTYEQHTTDKIDLFIEYYKIKTYINTEESRDINDTVKVDDIPIFIAQSDYQPNVKARATAVYEYLRQVVSDYNEINNVYIEMACLEYANWLESIYNPNKEASTSQISTARDKAHTAFNGALEQLGVDPKSIKLEESSKNSLGMKIALTERTHPADYYGQPDKIEKIKNIHKRYADDEYIYKFLVRAIRNYSRGESDYTGLSDADFNIRSEDDRRNVEILIGISEAVEEDERDDS